MNKKRVPYGVSNFEKLRKENRYFLDKTGYIENLENYSSPYVYFLRPRKFGKSFFTSMLEYYYDINHKDKFEELFKGTYIFEHQTPERNSYMIFSLKFSGIPTEYEIDTIQQKFAKYIQKRFELFILKYNLEKRFEKYLSLDLEPEVILDFIIEISQITNKKIFLLIDEYDNFINEILVSQGEQAYKNITHGDGFIRYFFKKLKDMTQEYVIDRIFITGVTPMAMNDLTSGFNVGDNISFVSTFGEMIGVTNEELIQVAEYYIDDPKQRNEALETMEKWYNGYSFNKKNIKNKIFNTTLIWHYMKSVLEEGEPPENMADHNVMTDFEKLKFIVITDKKLNGNFSVLKEVLEKKETSGQFIYNFSIGKKIKKMQFRSLLFYLGLLTIKDIVANRATFVIPNYTIEFLLWEYIREGLDFVYQELDIDYDLLVNELYNLAVNGTWNKLFGYILDKFYEIVSVRDFIFKEEGIKMFFLSYLSLSNMFIVRSESEQSQGFADIYLEPVIEQAKYRFIIEFKYLKTNSFENKKQITEKIKQKAIEQLQNYSKRFPKENVKCVVIIAGSKEVILSEEIKL